MLTRTVKTALVAAALAMVFGCSNGAFRQDSLTDQNWGRSQEAARYQQIANPDAGKNLDPVVGLDGDATLRNLERYRKSFEKTDKKTVYSIDVSGLGTSN